MANNLKPNSELLADEIAANISIGCVEGNRLKCAHLCILPYPMNALAVEQGISPIDCECEQPCVRYPANKESENAEDAFIPASTLEERIQREIDEFVIIDQIVDPKGFLHDNSWHTTLSNKTKEFVAWRKKNHPEWSRKE